MSKNPFPEILEPGSQWIEEEIEDIFIEHKDMEATPIILTEEEFSADYHAAEAWIDSDDLPILGVGEYSHI